MIQPLLMANRKDKGAGGATPMDWDKKVFTLTGKEDGHIYDLTIRVT